MQSPAVLIESEGADIAAWHDMYAASPAAFSTEYKLQAQIIDGALLLSSSGLDLGHFNSVIGLGLHSAVTDSSIRDITQRYRQAGVKQLTIHVTEGMEHQDRVEKILTEQDFKYTGSWDRIVRSSEATQPLSSSVEIVTAKTAVEWAQFIDKVYHLKNEPWLVALVGRAGWTHAVYRLDGQIVAARSIFVDTQSHHAWLGIDAPIPGYMTTEYGRDFAICEALVAEAAKAGAQRFFTDIEAAKADRAGPAYDGFQRLGFKPIYNRKNFTLKLT